ncbi:hypothetical protein ASPBRDRAFT_55723 [Aspergillus brasiliensis CBS 101740]|uniref:Uncharacterized protein n=1 Tax=Aspergillus brasiliensis (strain CBS 101740 / IMI 381727 / IBT 21946) TaxID=767769 RepID=A0A1L9UHK2_ASPBC|nr:hypothetical protein ASPBRDRAFT_55723 [Aspergillus brasiliensis CBS 101740]
MVAQGERERESGKRLQVDVKFPLSKANNTVTLLVIFSFLFFFPLKSRETPTDPAAANPVVRKEQRQKEVPFGCSILTSYFAALLRTGFPLVDKSDDSMADQLAPWPSLARSGSPPAFYDIMENRRWWPRDLPDGAGSSQGRTIIPPIIRPDIVSPSKIMSPFTPDLHAPLMQYSLPNNYYTPALHLLRAGSRDPAGSASAVIFPLPPPSPLSHSSSSMAILALVPEIRRTQSLTSSRFQGAS